LGLVHLLEVLLGDGLTVVHRLGALDEHLHLVRLGLTHIHLALGRLLNRHGLRNLLLLLLAHLLHVNLLLELLLLLLFANLVLVLLQGQGLSLRLVLLLLRLTVQLILELHILCLQVLLLDGLFISSLIGHIIGL